MRKYDIYELSLEVARLDGCEMPSDMKGAFVYCYVPSGSLEDSIHKMKKALLEDNYELIDIEYVNRIDFDDYEPSDVDFPTKEELIECLRNDEITYSPFYGYENVSEN